MGEAVVDDVAREAMETETRGLQRRAVSGVVWTFFGFGASRALAFLANIIVARLVFPDAFGLMGITFAVLTGLQMCSDLGLGASIIHNKRAEDPSFLHTAWTLQVCRGFILWALSIVLAVPVYLFNRQYPILLVLIPAAGMTAAIGGFNSLSLFTYKRRLHFGRVTILSFVANAIGSVVMVLVAWWHPSVWALFLHALVFSLVTLIGSFYYVPEIPMRFHWDREASREIVHFGRWIFLSSFLTFPVMNLDMLILSSLAGMSVLGIYYIGRRYARAAIEALQAITTTVLFPAYSQLARDDPDALRRQTFLARAGLLAIFLPVLWALAIGGNVVIDFFYNEEYADAGWMLRILSAGFVFTAITTTIDQVLLAQGDSFRHMLQLALHLVFQIIGMAIGAYFGGARGFIIGLVAADAVHYPVLVALVRKYGVWLPKLDAAAIAISAVVIGTGWYFF